jgi:hypothetical protein
LLVTARENLKMNDEHLLSVEERVRRGQSVALGDTGDGHAGVPSDEQGISNRPGDMDAVAGLATGDGIADESDEIAADEVDDEDELEEAEEDEDADEVDDPEAEPEKPI